MSTITGKGDLPSPAELRSRRAKTSKYDVIPGPKELKKYLDLGMTQQQIADLVYEQTGHRVTRAAVGMALHRAGLTRGKERYEAEVPWRVRREHESEYALAMLRVYARRQRDKPITPGMAARLDAWLERLESWEFPDGTRGAVVVYRPRSARGFYYVPRRPSDVGIVRGPDRDRGYQDFTESPSRGPDLAPGGVYRDKA